MSTPTPDPSADWPDSTVAEIRSRALYLHERMQADARMTDDAMSAEHRAVAASMRATLPPEARFMDDRQILAVALAVAERTAMEAMERPQEPTP